MVCETMYFLYLPIRNSFGKMSEKQHTTEKRQGYIADKVPMEMSIDKGLSRNDVTFLGGRGVSQKVTKSDRGEGGSQPKSDDTK